MNKKAIYLSLFLMASLSILSAQSRSNERLLQRDWSFANEEMIGGQMPEYDDSSWQHVRIPHDWAIYGSFSSEHDKQHTAIKEDGQKLSMEHTCRTGALPFVGIGWYRRVFELDKDLRKKVVEIGFDGAMSHARIYINGQEVAFHPYGYSSFFLDITSYVRPGKNLLAVRLENKPESSRWYPGAGLYRNVRLRVLPQQRIATWGTQIYTQRIKDNVALVQYNVAVAGLAKGETVELRTRIINPAGEEVYSSRDVCKQYPADTLLRQISIPQPDLWHPGRGKIYTAQMALVNTRTGKRIDAASVRFGIRTIEVDKDKGILINDSLVKFRGVCLHHDLGPLGGAAMRDAMRRQILLMRDMGANAIRTSHNMPDPAFVELCDSLGMMLMCESFDEWREAKMSNGYHRQFDQIDPLSGEPWWRKDLGDMIRLYRSSPSIIMWSIGNEIHEQGNKAGLHLGTAMQQLCNELDPSRPVTMGLNGIVHAIKGGLAQQMQIPGVNYNLHDYPFIHKHLPQGFLLATETCSTVSSRGVYKFPVKRRAMQKYADGQSSSYDVETVGWGNLPDDDFLCEDEQPGYIGQFIWTGMDYLGEPTPYYSDFPNHSSLFGAVDLAGLPKDRFYLYRSRWNKESATLHLLPHWTWPGHEGQTIPVMCYTSYPEAELFVNGHSFGRKSFDQSVRLTDLTHPAADTLLVRQGRYRLIWPDIPYTPGTLRLVAYHPDGSIAGSVETQTAGTPYAVKLEADTTTLSRGGESFSFITASIVDKDGHLCPDASNLLTFDVQGQASFRAAANGDARSLDLFHLPHHHTFSGKLVLIIASGDRAGSAQLTVRGEHLQPASLDLQIR